MLNKFLQHGKGDPALAASYVLDDVDHLNVARADVHVLRGDPQTFAAIAESIENQWKYTSGAICWSVEDNPTDDDINEYLDAFEAHAFAGLQPHQYHFTAVLHEEDDGSKHVHFLVPRVELTTGKALNIAPPGHESYFDPLRDYFNYKKGWSRPDDPKLKRDTQTPDHDHFQQVSALKAGLSVCKTAKDIREVIGVYIEQRIQFGEIKNRHDVINALNDAEIGEITRISDNFISVKPLGSEKAIRLKGAFYESEFSVESYIENRTRKENDAGASNTSRFISEQDKEYAEELRARVTELAKSAQHTTSTVMDLAQQAQESMTLVQSESKNLAQSLQAQVQQASYLCSQQMQQLQQLKAQSAQLSNISQDIFKTAKLKKALFTSNVILASIALILLISSFALAYVSKSKYNEMQAREARLQQIEATTQQKIQEYNTVTTALYKARGGK